MKDSLEPEHSCEYSLRNEFQFPLGSRSSVIFTGIIQIRRDVENGSLYAFFEQRGQSTIPGSHLQIDASLELDRIFDPILIRKIIPEINGIVSTLDADIEAKSLLESSLSKMDKYLEVLNSTT